MKVVLLAWRKRCVILFCKVRITSGRAEDFLVRLRRITGYDCLVATPGPLFRRPIFVVNKGLLIPEEELAMYLPLLLNKIAHYV